MSSCVCLLEGWNTGEVVALDTVMGSDGLTTFTWSMDWPASIRDITPGVAPPSPEKSAQLLGWTGLPVSETSHQEVCHLHLDSPKVLSLPGLPVSESHTRSCAAFTWSLFSCWA
ncbi:hypothetical protein PoB_004818400 [Plakobranchus ocellatus]|uniref:Uncharacterized protein n=1 Tax=Plakobranchus ocellatus TaxID=259542 RepID=A0AAV4BNJ6_9GAST|nr:hypothetical protein PoB_004818400 [Plakobranchus ocellatus]